MQAYFVYCASHEGLVAPFYGECLETEICVEGRSSYDADYDYDPNYHSTAYCQSTSNFVKIAQTELDKMEEVAALAASVGNQVQKHGVHALVAAILTTLDGKSALNATFLQIEAQSVKEIFGAKSYTTLPGGLSGCWKCASARVQPIPVGTNFIQLHIVLPVGGSGRLYLPYINLK